MSVSYSITEQDGLFVLTFRRDENFFDYARIRMTAWQALKFSTVAKLKKLLGLNPLPVYVPAGAVFESPQMPCSQ
jgi:hypothetical protein